MGVARHRRGPCVVGRVARGCVVGVGRAARGRPHTRTCVCVVCMSQSDEARAACHVTPHTANAAGILTVWHYALNAATATGMPFVTSVFSLSPHAAGRLPASGKWPAHASTHDAGVLVAMALQPVRGHCPAAALAMTCGWPHAHRTECDTTFTDNAAMRSRLALT